RARPRPRRGVELPAALHARVRRQRGPAAARLRLVRARVVSRARRRRRAAVSPLLAQRQLSLGAATLLAVIVALAVAHETSGPATSAVGAQPEATSPAEWNRALAGVERGLPRVSACG